MLFLAVYKYSHNHRLHARPIMLHIIAYIRKS